MCILNLVLHMGQFRKCQQLQNLLEKLHAVKSSGNCVLITSVSSQGLLLFIIYAGGLPRRINSLSEPIMFADDTSAIISNINCDDLLIVSNSILSHMHKWFAANKGSNPR